MFISYFIFTLATYTVYSFNLSCLTYLIEDGYFDNPFWTRSLRAMFLAPPFAILIVGFLVAKQSLKSNIKNIQVVMKKRED
jgi:pilus assembly protein TadC